MSIYERKNFTPMENVTILRWHFIEKAPDSNLCEEYYFHTSLLVILR